MSTRHRLLAVLAFAQISLGATASHALGVISGFVLDGRTGQPVRNAELTLEGTQANASADLNGVFEIEAPAGEWSVEVKADGYQARRILGVTVVENGVATLSVVLDPASANAGAEASPTSDAVSALSESITVEAEADRATEQAMLADRKASARIVDNIGAEEISKNTGSDAAGVLQRVTGISVQDGKYIYVRGLGDRYSNTQLNGSRIPSTEFEKKVVPLDLFPADLIERVTVSKSYSVDQPGDFVAGVVELETKKFPARQRFSVGVDAATNSETTGERFLQVRDGLAFSGGGGRGLPAGIPEEPLLRFNPFTDEGFTPEELESFGELLIDEWAPRERTAPRDRGLKLGYGNSYDRFGLYLSATWEGDRETVFEERTFYSISGQGVLSPEDDYDIESGTEQVRRSLMGNLALRVGDNSQLQLRALDTTLASSLGRFQTGIYSDLQNLIEDFRIQYRDQEVLALQLSGDHFSPDLGGSGGSVFEWKASHSQATTAEDLRETVYQLSGSEFEFSSQGQSGFLFYNDLEDTLGDYRADWQFFWNAGESFGSLKVGGAYFDSERDFDGRRLRYFPRRLSGFDLTGSPNEIFTAENINPNLFEIREVTNPTDEYGGTHTIPGAYAQADWTFGKWRLIGGVRYEDSAQEIVTNALFSDDLDVITLDRDDILPAASVVYALSGRASLRASVSRTVNRPEYRELAPFEFVTLVGGYTSKGNPELDRATVDSADLRWELFPSGSEVLAVSAFYKKFDQPIESALLAGAGLIETYLNAEGARNYGVELEARKHLGFLSDALSSFTAILNVTFVDSQVTLDRESTIGTNLERALVGQPDSVANVVLEWAPPRQRTTLRLLYNFTDEKVAFAGSKGRPDVIEERRDTLDLVWRQDLWRGLALKVSGSNLTDQQRTWAQGSEVWRQYNPGRAFSLSLGYTF